MICQKCRKKVGEAEARCPHCGQPNPAGAGTFRTSTVLISAGGAEHVYRSVDEVPPRLRTRLLKSTNGQNSATVLIADRRGRKALARAMRRLPGARQRRLRQALLAPEPPDLAAWLTPRRRGVILAGILLACLALVAAVFHRW